MCNPEVGIVKIPKTSLKHLLAPPFSDGLRPALQWSLV